jgi:hypothetical protein
MGCLLAALFYWKGKNMAAIHGKFGDVVFAGMTCDVYSWTGNATADVAETTIMDNQAVAAGTHWKGYAAGFKDWTATAEMQLPAAGVGLTVLGTSGTLGLWSDINAAGGRKYTGTAICTSIVPSTERHDVGAVSATFQGNGQLTEAAA